MATSSIHIDSGAPGYFAHNSRETKTVNSIFNDEPNYCSCSNVEAFDLYKKELAIRSAAYEKRTGQKLQKKTVTHLSAIVNFNSEHTAEDMQRLCDYLEKELDTKVIQFAMHRDEGHISESGEKIKNYHAHIEFMGLDSQGNSIKRTLGKKELIQLQSKTAEILGMERGRNYTAEKARRPQRLDTYQYKRAKENESLVKKEIETQLSYQFKAYQRKITALENVTNPLKKELHGLNNEISKLKNDTELKKQKIAELNRKIENLARHQTEMAHNQTEMALELQEKEKTIESLSSDLDSADELLIPLLGAEEIENITTYPSFFLRLQEKFKEMWNYITHLEAENKALREENIELREEKTTSSISRKRN